MSMELPALGSSESTNGIVSTRAFIYRNDGKLLLARRAPKGEQSDLWEFPGGKIDLGESPQEAVIRETREETGIDIDLTSDPLLVHSRSIEDGKHKGKLYTSIGFTAVVRNPDQIARPLDGVTAVRWLLPDQIVALPDLTLTSRQAAEKFL